MNIEDTILKELEVINQPLGTISTVNGENGPESASLYYIHDNALNIFFVTRSDSRKFKNLLQNPRVAFVVTSEHPPKTIQLEGSCHEVSDPNEQLAYFEKLVTQATEHMSMPPVSQLASGEMVFMKMTTTWARLGNFEIMKEGDKFIEVKI